MALSDIVVLGLATFRLACLVALDEGPANVLLRTRSVLGAYDYAENGRAKTSLGRGVACPYCVGVYAAALLLWLGPKRWVTWLLAVAGVQSLIHSVWER